MMQGRVFAPLLILAVLVFGGPVRAERQKGAPPEDLAKAFLSPPDSAKTRAFWWWLNGKLGGSAPDGSVLLDHPPSVPGEEACRSAEVLDLSDRMDAAGRLRWQAPEGDWIVVRVGYTCSGAQVSTSSEGWNGLVVDYLDADSLRWYWHEVVRPLIDDAGPAVGRTWKYVHTDSWECGGMNWTPSFREEFRQRRGYDLLPFLPVMAGKIVDSREATHRFLADFRRTIGDCIAENHYAVMKQLAEVRLNGQNLGVVWCPPWRVEITNAIRYRGNTLEIDVVNFWPNRLIGDAALPPEKRRTSTNITKFRPDSPLMESGLFGPVSVVAEDRIE